MTLTPEKKHALFKLMADHTLYETGVALGMDKHYKNTSSLKQAVRKHYVEVRENPAEFGITQETVDLITKIVSSRQTTTFKGADNRTIAERKAELANKDITELVLTGRTKAMSLVHRKLDMIDKSTKELKSTSLQALTTAAAILFDKGQIVQGQATENIAVLSKVADDMTPDEALDMILKTRQRNVEEKTSKK